MTARPSWLIVGAGSFGTAFAHVMGSRGVNLTLATRTTEHASDIRAAGSNERYFPGVRLPDHMRIVTVEQAAQASYDTIVLAVPTSSFSSTLATFAGCGRRFLSLGKGLDPDGRRLSEAAGELVSADRFIALSGPNIAKEIVADLPTAAVVAGADMDEVRDVQQIVNGFAFRVYSSDDLVGVELAGATKNVVALAAGVLQGSGIGDNGVSALMTRGLGEMARVGLASGAQIQTYLGLAGVGDLITTCASPHSRNRRAGALLALGHSPDKVRAEIGQAVEGLRTAPVMRDLADRLGVRISICRAVADVADGSRGLNDAARSILESPPDLEFMHA